MAYSEFGILHVQNISEPNIYGRPRLIRSPQGGALAGTTVWCRLSAVNGQWHAKEVGAMQLGWWSLSQCFTIEIP